MAEERKKYEYPIVANAWNKQTYDGREYYSISWKEDMTIKKDTPIFMCPNKHRRPDKNDPHWTLSIKGDEKVPHQPELHEDTPAPPEASDPVF